MILLQGPGSNPGLRKEGDWLKTEHELPKPIKVNCFLLLGMSPPFLGNDLEARLPDCLT